MLETDVAVIGSGPAGMAAALEASEAGAKVTIIDEYSRPGGQIFRQPPDDFNVEDHPQVAKVHEKGKELLERIAAGKIEVMQDTLVWGVFGERVLALYQGDKSFQLKPKKIILATGAYERVIAFPGWTLPGVITAGGAQAMVKGQCVLPGKRILVAGSGAFLLPVATQIVQAGGTVAAIIEASSRKGWLKAAPGMLGNWGHIQEAREYWKLLDKANVPIEYGQAVIGVVGTEKVEGAIVAKLDSEWRPIKGSERTIECDVIATGFGFLPSTQLPRLLECQMEFDPSNSTFIPKHSADMETSVEGVFVAGEVAGIGGAEIAIEEGTIAGVAAARALGLSIAKGAEERVKAARKQLPKSYGFMKGMNEVFEIKPGIYDIITDETIVCRCEEITAGQIRALVPEFTNTLLGIKNRTRTGMGMCQGRMCEALVARIIADKSGKSIADVGQYRVRPPVKPIPLKVLAEAEVEPGL